MSLYFPTPAECSLHTIFPGVTVQTCSADKMMLCLATLQPHSVVEEHSHPHEQMGILISGRLEFTIGGVTKVLNPGDLWRIPGGVLHKAVAVDGPAVALDCFHPIREDYL